MAARRKLPVEARVDRLEQAFVRLEQVGHDTSERLGRIEDTLRVSSHIFELMDSRLEKLEEGQQALVEGQNALVEGQKALVEGQKRVVERLDRLVEASTRDRTAHIERLAKLEQRMDDLDRR